METEDGILYHSGQWQVVKQLCELFPHVGISVLAQALIIESISVDKIIKLDQILKNG